MATIQTIGLIDNIRKDAKILMESRPNISYLEAYELARQNLIGSEKITEFSQPPLSVVMNIDGKKQTVESESNINKNDTIFENDSDSYYRAEAEKELKGKLNIADYTTDQLKAYVVAHKMGVDVSKFASELYSVEQINFLAMLVTMGKDISKYIDNYNFDAGAEFVKMALEEERESQLRYEDTMI